MRKQKIEREFIIFKNRETGRDNKREYGENWRKGKEDRRQILHKEKGREEGE